MQSSAISVQVTYAEYGSIDRNSEFAGKIETARYNITVSTLSKLCNYYGITLKEFFDKLSK